MRAPGLLVCLSLLPLLGCPADPELVGAPANVQARELSPLPEELLDSLCSPERLGARSYALALAQGGEEIPVRGQRASLEAAPFELIFCVQGPAGASRSAAPTSRSSRSSTAGTCCSRISSTPITISG
jgi:hypothetical protein